MPGWAQVLESMKGGPVSLLLGIQGLTCLWTPGFPSLRPLLPASFVLLQELWSWRGARVGRKEPFLPPLIHLPLFPASWETNEEGASGLLLSVAFTGLSCRLRSTSRPFPICKASC